MKLITVVLFCVANVLIACANPVNRATSDNYAETCATAERNGNLKVAEEACYRALVNVDWGNLGVELKSQRLYNLGRIKRQLAKFSEAEQLFKESLGIEQTLSFPTDPKIGRRLVELSVCLAAQNKWEDGAQYLKQSIPIADKFSGRERSYIAEVLLQYGKHMRKSNNMVLAEQFESEASRLR